MSWCRRWILAAAVAVLATGVHLPGADVGFPVQEESNGSSRSANTTFAGGRGHHRLSIAEWAAAAAADVIDKPAKTLTAAPASIAETLEANKASDKATTKGIDEAASAKDFSSESPWEWGGGDDSHSDGTAADGNSSSATRALPQAQAPVSVKPPTDKAADSRQEMIAKMMGRNEVSDAGPLQAELDKARKKANEKAMSKGIADAAGAKAALGGRPNYTELLKEAQRSAARSQQKQRRVSGLDEVSVAGPLQAELHKARKQADKKAMSKGIDDAVGAKTPILRKAEATEALADQEAADIRKAQRAEAVDRLQARDALELAVREGDLARRSQTAEALARREALRAREALAAERLQREEASDIKKAQAAGALGLKKVTDVGPLQGESDLPTKEVADADPLQAEFDLQTKKALGISDDRIARTIRPEEVAEARRAHEKAFAAREKAAAGKLRRPLYEQAAGALGAPEAAMHFTRKEREVSEMLRGRDKDLGPKEEVERGRHSRHTPLEDELLRGQAFARRSAAAAEWAQKEVSGERGRPGNVPQEKPFPLSKWLEQAKKNVSTPEESNDLHPERQFADLRQKEEESRELHRESQIADAPPKEELRELHREKLIANLRNKEDAMEKREKRQDGAYDRRQDKEEGKPPLRELLKDSQTYRRLSPLRKAGVHAGGSSGRLREGPPYAPFRRGDYPPPRGAVDGARYPSYGGGDYAALERRGNGPEYPPYGGGSYFRGQPTVPRDPGERSWLQRDRRPEGLEFRSDSRTRRDYGGRGRWRGGARSPDDAWRMNSRRQHEMMDEPRRWWRRGPRRPSYRNNDSYRGREDRGSRTEGSMTEARDDDYDEPLRRAYEEESDGPRGKRHSRNDSSSDRRDHSRNGSSSDRRDHSRNDSSSDRRDHRHSHNASRRNSASMEEHDGADSSRHKNGSNHSDYQEAEYEDYDYSKSKAAFNEEDNESRAAHGKNASHIKRKDNESRAAHGKNASHIKRKDNTSISPKRKWRKHVAEHRTNVSQGRRKAPVDEGEYDEDMEDDAVISHEKEEQRKLRQKIKAAKAALAEEDEEPSKKGQEASGDGVEEDEEPSKKGQEASGDGDEEDKHFRRLLDAKLLSEVYEEDNPEEEDETDYDSLEDEDAANDSPEVMWSRLKGEAASLHEVGSQEFVDQLEVGLEQGDYYKVTPDAVTPPLLANTSAVAEVNSDDVVAVPPPAGEENLTEASLVENLPVVVEGMRHEPPREVPMLEDGQFDPEAAAQDPPQKSTISIGLNNDSWNPDEAGGTRMTLIIDYAPSKQPAE